MRSFRTRREVVAALLPVGAAMLALGLVAGSDSLAPNGLLPQVPLLAGLGLLTLALMLHRPFEGPALGAGAAAIPAVMTQLGGAPAVLLGGGAVLGAEALRRLLRRYSPSLEERRQPFRSLELASLVMVALVLAAVAGRIASPSQGAGVAPRLLPIAVAGLVYGIAIGGLLVLDKKLRRPLRPIPWKSSLIPISVDLLAWVVGAGVALVTARLGWGTASLLLAGGGLLALEAGRQTLRHGIARKRVESLERLTRANRRIAGNETGMTAVADRIRIECLNVVPFQWFQFELLARESSYRSWWTGPDRTLQEGEPNPPDSPPALPGIHRRAPWKVLERALETEDRLVGRLRLWCDPRRLDPGAAELLDSLLPQMVASLQRTLLDREAKQDPLTGLAMRRVLEERMQNAFRGACSRGGSMAVIMCDLDHFKSVNDTHGHAAGDEALIATARLLLAHETEGRLCARYGGEEFTVLLEDADGRTALEVAEELRRDVEALKLVVEGVQIPLTQSLGVASFPELYVKRPEDLLELADAALYEAKHHGRNRCLLNLGGGRFLTVEQDEVKSAEAESGEAAEEKPQEVPRLFA